MTPILFWNIKWLFVRFTFCHRTTVMLDTQWQNARTFLECINMRYTTEHDSKLSRYHIQNNCSMCPPFTRTTAFSLSRHWSMDLLMICWSRLSQQVCTLFLWSSRLEIGMQYTLCCRAPRQYSRQDLSPGWWVAIQTVRWNSARYAAGTRQLTSLDETARRPLKYERSSDFWRMSRRRHRCSRVSR